MSFEVTTRVIVVDLYNCLKVTDWGETEYGIANVIQSHSRGVGSWQTSLHGSVGTATRVMQGMSHLP